MKGKLGLRIRELIREICMANNVEIIRGHVSLDHIHILISAPPQLSISKIAQYVKGKTSRKIMQEFPEIGKKFWGQHFWGRGYYAVSSGVITDEMIMEYIESQDEDREKRGDNFTTVDVSN